MDMMDEMQVFVVERTYRVLPPQQRQRRRIAPELRSRARADVRAPRRERGRVARALFGPAEPPPQQHRRADLFIILFINFFYCS